MVEGGGIFGETDRASHLDVSSIITLITDLEMLTNPCEQNRYKFRIID